MKRYLLSIFLVFCFHLSFSQTPYSHYIPFPEDSAQWSVWYMTSSTIDAVQYRMKGDTLINGIGYNKIYKSYNLNYNSIDTILNCFIRQDTASKRVFARYPYSAFQDSSEFVLYDFNLSTGDTFNLKILPNHITYPLAIISVDTMQLNFDFRRVLSANVVDTCGLPYCLWGIGMDHSVTWVEGMGSLANFLYCEIPVNCCFSSGYSEQCFWYNGRYDYGGTFCDGTGLEELSINEFEKIEVYPNPISSRSTIKFKNPATRSFSIFSSTGIKVKTIDIITSNLELNVDELSDGLYLLVGYSVDQKINSLVRISISK